MRNAIKLVLALTLGAATLQIPARAEDKTAFKDDKEKASYAVGLFWGNQLKGGNLDSLDLDVTVAAVRDVLAGKELKLTMPDARTAIGDYQKKMAVVVAEKNRQAGAAFLEENKKKPGIKTQTITVNGAPVELQYKIITEGAGASPKSNDVVSVNYRGTLINGKEFDSSAKHGGQPSKFTVNRVVRGWTEALQMMTVGSKWELYLPSALAYGDAGTPGIEPGSTLIFEVELLGVEAPPPPPAPAQPLTSDIIKVPSAEEIKKGAKIEVIKPEDVAKHIQGSNAAPAKTP